MAAVKKVLFKYLRVNTMALSHNPITNSALILSFNRHFSDEINGLFLDKSEVTDRVISVVKKCQKIDSSKITPNAHFKNDLGLDSLDTAEVVMALEEEFGFDIPNNEADKISTINHAVEFIASHPQAK